MTHSIYYTALKPFGPTTGDGTAWKKYIQWARLPQLTELISLDGILNAPVFEPNFNSDKVWSFILTNGQNLTSFFTSKEYVLEHVNKNEHFNFMAVIQEPLLEKAALESEFDFVGYDLIDKTVEISALVNCGGFDETFLPSDLNEFGLISDYYEAKRIQNMLPQNNPNDPHADCYLYEVWRHKTVGRKWNAITS